MTFYDVYVTAKDEDEARKIANNLLEKRLIACANIFPIKSLYRWKGAIKSEDEVALIMKTQKRNLGSITTEVKMNHSYEVPCIVFLPIENGDRDFLEWIKNETSQL